MQEDPTHIVTVPFMHVRFMEIWSMQIGSVITQVVGVIMLIVSELVIWCQGRENAV
jgi:hypothetical protein